MAYSPKLTAFAQSVYLAIKNRYFDDIASDDGQVYISEVMDWINQYLDEYETTVDSMDQPVFWNSMRSTSLAIATAVGGATQADITETILSLIATPKRPLTITVNGIVVSRWTVVRPNQFDDHSSNNYVTQVGDVLYFNKALSAAENNGTIAADVTVSLNRVTISDVSALDAIKPRQLMVLGVAKNSSLPDIVQGGLSPSFVQKYNDLLTAAILYNNATATADTLDRDDFSFVSGIGF